MTAEAPVCQAPEGFFTTLISLKEGRLGNAYTKRFVRVLRMPDIWPGLKANLNLRDDMAVVLVSIRSHRGQYIEENHFLGISPDDKITLLESWKYRGSQYGKEDLATPSIDVLLGHIQAAQKLQSSLKRK